MAKTRPAGLRFDCPKVHRWSTQWTGHLQSDGLHVEAEMEPQQPAPPRVRAAVRDPAAYPVSSPQEMRWQLHATSDGSSSVFPNSLSTSARLGLMESCIVRASFARLKRRVVIRSPSNALELSGYGP